VAVHGLGGDALKTWTAENGKMWLRDFLPDDLRDGAASCHARVMTFGYDVNVYSKAASQRSFTFAEDLLSALYDHRQERSGSRRPIIFIGHSLGGIVIKKVQLLVLSTDANMSRPTFVY
jgi:alpha-beta hydrolase superfamily lysophospholipase